MDRTAIGKVCLALPGGTLDHPFGDDQDVYKVGGKMFAIMGADGNVAFKVSDIAYEILTDTGRAQAAPYMARAKWVNLPDPSDWDVDELAEHLVIAHRIVAAKLTKKARGELGF